MIGSAANIKEKQDLYMIIKKKAFMKVMVAALMAAGRADLNLWKRQEGEE